MILRSRGAKAPLLSVDLMPARVALNLRESGAVFPCKWCSVAEIYKFDRKVTFSPAFLPGRGWQTPQLFRTRKDTERGCAFCAQSYFSCLSKFSVIQFSQVIRPKETLCGTNEYNSPYVHIQHTEKLGSQLSKSHRWENHL